MKKSNLFLLKDQLLMVSAFLQLVTHVLMHKYIHSEDKTKEGPFWYWLFMQFIFEKLILSDLILDGIEACAAPRISLTNLRYPSRFHNIFTFKILQPFGKCAELV